MEPALRALAAADAPVKFGHRLRALSFDGQRVTALDFGEDTIQLGPDDAIILAVPPTVAAALLPGLQTPDEFRAIVNAHFRVDPPAGCPPMIGVINGTAEWVFAFPAGCR